MSNLQEPSELRRALRFMLDIESAAEVLSEKLRGSQNQNQIAVREALIEVHNSIQPLRSVVAGFDADEALFNLLFTQLDSVPEFAQKIPEITHNLKGWVGSISRHLHSEKGLLAYGSTIKFGQKLSSYEKNRNRHIAILEAFTGQVRLQSMPWRHLLDMSNICNLRCKTCYQSKDQDFIYSDLSNACIDELGVAASFADYASIGGTGEPLLSASTSIVSRCYSEMGAFVTLTTNGTLLDRLERVGDSFNCIDISFDGASTETFESVRTGAKFSRLIDGLSKLPTHIKTKINFNCVLTHCNVNEVGDIVSLAADLKIRSVTFQEFNSYLDWHDDMELTFDDRTLFFNQLAIARAKYELSLVIVSHIALASSNARKDNSRIISSSEVLLKLKGMPSPKSSRTDWAELALEITTLSVDALKQFLAFLEKIAKNSSTEVETVNVDSEVLSNRIQELTLMLNAQIESNQAIAPMCMAPFNLLYLQSDGNLRPCCVLRTQVGTLKGRNFNEAWNDPAFVRFRAQLHRSDPVHPACLKCTDSPRYGDFVSSLEFLVAQGFDIRQIAKPKNFNPAHDIAIHPLVVALGSKFEFGVPFA